MQFTLIHGLNIPGSCAVLFFTAEDLTFTTRHIHNIASFLLWPSHFILFGAIHNCPLLFPSSILDTFWPGVGGGHLLVSYLLAFSYCPWGSPGKNTGVSCHFLLQWTAFCHNCSLWPSWLELHGMVHSFTELHKPLCHNKAVMHEGVLLLGQLN